MSTLLQLLTPLAYLRIEHPLKRRFDVYIPMVFTIIIAVVFINLPAGITVFGKGGLISEVSGLIQILVGFFIASLAAVSTFQRSNLDDPIEGSPASLEIKIKGERKKISLTRRRFLSLLFGYLAFISIFIYFIGVFSNLAVESLRILIPVYLHYVIKWSFVSIYIFLVSNMLITTLLGLHYMADRIHR